MMLNESSCIVSRILRALDKIQDYIYLKSLKNTVRIMIKYWPNFGAIFWLKDIMVFHLLGFMLILVSRYQMKLRGKGVVLKL